LRRRSVQCTFGRKRAADTQLWQVFRCLEENGFIEERILDQVYSPKDGRYLPDRYIIGTCPKGSPEDRA
jgi:methionyl-tRNA synthetase